MEKNQDNETQKQILNATASLSTTPAKVKENYNARRDRGFYDDINKRARIRDKEIFDNKKTTIDPYSGNVLHRNKDSASAKYGSDRVTYHIGQTDHTVPIEKVYNLVQLNPYLTAEQTKKIVNVSQNYVFTNAHFNTSKKHLTNLEYIKKYRSDLSDIDLARISLTSEDKLSSKVKPGNEISDKQVKAMLEEDFKARIVIGAVYSKETFSSISHEAIDGACNTLKFETVFASYRHLNNVFSGEESAEEAFIGAVKEIQGAAVQGAVTTVAKKGIEQTALQGIYAVDEKLAKQISEKFLSNADFIKIAEAVKQVGYSVYRYVQGEISLEELALESGKEGSALAMMSLAGAEFAVAGKIVGGVLGGMFIPFLFGKEIGEAVGAITGEFIGNLVGYAVGQEWFKLVSQTFDEARYVKEEYENIRARNDLIRAQLDKIEKDLDNQIKVLGIRREVVNLCLDVISSDCNDTQYFEACKMLSILCGKNMENRKTQEQTYNMMIDDEIPFEL